MFQSIGVPSIIHHRLTICGDSMKRGPRFKTPEELRNQRIRNFWKRVDKAGPDVCWNWKAGQLTRRGYGVIVFSAKADRNKTQLAHRFSYELAYGPIPKGEGAHGTVIAHSCDNPRCVNPNHLRATTQRDNLRECLAKGRGNKAKGEKAGRTKLTAAQVAMIREKIRSGSFARDLAREFHVTFEQVRTIAAAQTWAYLECMKDGALSLAADTRPKNTKPNSGSFQKGCKGNPGAKPELRTIDYARAKELHSTGLSIRAVARAMNTTHTTVRRAIGDA